MCALKGRTNDRQENREERGEKMVAIDAATADIAHKFAGNS
jgi:hypothetical protein